jgi:hypothetical protein
MKRLVFLGVLLCALLVCQVPRTNAQVAPQNGSSVCAGGRLVLYDDLRGPRIDPNKWTGIWGDFSDLREMTREVTREPWRRDRALRVSMRSYANTWDDSGGLGGPFGLVFTQPDRVTEVAFTVTVRAAGARRALHSVRHDSAFARGLAVHRPHTGAPQLHDDSPSHGDGGRLLQRRLRERPVEGMRASAGGAAVSREKDRPAAQAAGLLGNARSASYRYTR